MRCARGDFAARQEVRPAKRSVLVSLPPSLYSRGLLCAGPDGDLQHAGASPASVPYTATCPAPATAASLPAQRTAPSSEAACPSTTCNLPTTTVPAGHARWGGRESRYGGWCSCLHDRSPGRAGGISPLCLAWAGQEETHTQGSRRVYLRLQQRTRLTCLPGLYWRRYN